MGSEKSLKACSCTIYTVSQPGFSHEHGCSLADEPTPAPVDVASLVERLRATEFDNSSTRAPYQKLRNPDGPEAAKQIKELSALLAAKDAALRDIAAGKFSEVGAIRAANAALTQGAKA